MIALAMENAVGFTVRQLLEEHLRKLRSHSKTIFCSRLPIRDQCLRIRRR